MRHLLAASVLLSTPAWALGPGSVAFTGYNADGTDDLAMVTLVDLVNETIYLTDAASDGAGGLAAGEGIWRWDTGVGVIPAGTVIAFSTLTTAGAVSHGTLTAVDPGFNLIGEGDSVLAYQGPDHTTPTVFLAGIEGLIGAAGDLTGTGLTNGLNFVTFTSGVADDVGVYVGDRSGLVSLSAYLPLINDRTLWDTASNDGLHLLPFDTTAFVTIAAVPALPPLALALLAAGLGAVGVGSLRRDD
jgi:hypothetical protein